MNEGDAPDEARKTWSSRTPMGRMGWLDELTGIVDMLCSPAGSYTTGADIVVAGKMRKSFNSVLFTQGLTPPRASLLLSLTHAQADSACSSIIMNTGCDCIKIPGIQLRELRFVAISDTTLYETLLSTWWAQ